MERNTPDAWKFKTHETRQRTSQQTIKHVWKLKRGSPLETRCKTHGARMGKTEKESIIKLTREKMEKKIRSKTRRAWGRQSEEKMFQHNTNKTEDPKDTGILVGKKQLQNGAGMMLQCWHDDTQCQEHSINDTGFPVANPLKMGLVSNRVNNNV